MPTCTENGKNNSIDWRDRSLFPPEEPVWVDGIDHHGFVRTREITWGDIDGDIAHAKDGPLRIEAVRRVADRPIHEEELIAQGPYAIRESMSPTSPSLPDPGDTDRWRAQLERNLGRSTRQQVAEELAEELGVLPTVLLDLGLHHDTVESEWLIPERDSYEAICGLAVRYWYPWQDEQGKLVTKGFRTGGHRGLYYLDSWQYRNGPILSPEGLSDTAACLSMGINTIGRSSATGGREQLCWMFSEYQTSEDLIIIADRDVNDDNVNVGLEGARRTANYLANQLSTTILVALPPDGCKDTREWLQRFCNGDLSPNRLAAARNIFLEHVYETAEKIEPGKRYFLLDDDREVLSLDEWRSEMQEARIASVRRPSHYADFSPTGAGKSFADRALIQSAQQEGKTVLLVVPTHANCREEVQQLGEAGIDAVVYPELNRETCQRYGEASTARKQGLDLVRAVCASCPLMHNNTCRYRHQIDRAQQSQVAVCTTARLGMDREVSRSRDVISVHEVADSAICGQYSLSRTKIERARRVLRLIRNSRMEPYIHSERALRRTDETRVYLTGLVSICDVMLEALQTGCRPRTYTPPELPPGYWAKFVHQWLNENAPSEEFLRLCEEADFPWPDDRIDGQTLRGLVLAAQGVDWDVMIWPVEANGGRCTESRIMVQRRLQFQEGQVWWWQDATGELEQLQKVIGCRVRDMTPRGRLEQRQTVEVVPVDISRKTAVSKVVDAIRMLIMTSDCERLGVIGHKIHMDQLMPEDSELLAPEIRQRIHMTSYYGAGVDRGSNRWLECDRLLVLGTPRIGDEAIREELWRAGQLEAARVCEPGWGEYTWEARPAEDCEEPLYVAGRCYTDPVWHQACLRITRAAIRQALGRARVILGCGVPATIWTTEELREFPVGLESPPHTAIIDAVQILWIADRQASSQPRRRGVRVDDEGRVWLTGAEVARRLGLTRATVCRVLTAAAEQGLVERAQRRQGWSICDQLRAE